MRKCLVQSICNFHEISVSYKYRWASSIHAHNIKSRAKCCSIYWIPQIRSVFLTLKLSKHSVAKNNCSNKSKQLQQSSDPGSCSNNWNDNFLTFSAFFCSLYLMFNNWKLVSWIHSSSLLCSPHPSASSTATVSRVWWKFCRKRHYKKKNK